MNSAEPARKFTVAVAPATTAAIDRVAELMKTSRSGLIDLLLGVMVPTLDALAVKAEAARDAGRELSMWDLYGDLAGIHRANTEGLSAILADMSTPSAASDEPEPMCSMCGHSMLMHAHHVEGTPLAGQPGSRWSCSIPKCGCTAFVPTPVRKARARKQASGSES